jgi:diguanylate cyclase (GGDEF)-like protein
MDGNKKRKKRPCMARRLRTATSLFLVLTLLQIAGGYFFLWRQRNESSWSVTALADAAAKNVSRSLVASEIRNMSMLKDLFTGLKEQDRRMLGEYALATGNEVVFLNRGGVLLHSTIPISEGALRTMDVPFDEPVTVKSPVILGENVFVPVYLPLQGDRGVLVVLWKPRLLGMKRLESLSWQNEMLVAGNGMVIQSSVEPFATGTILNEPLDGGVPKRFLLNGRLWVAIPERITLPGRLSDHWWHLSVVDIGELRSDTFRTTWIFLALFIPAAVAYSAVLFRLRHLLLDDLQIIRDIISRYYAHGKSGRILSVGENTSEEFYALARLFMHVTEKVEREREALENDANLDKLTGIANRAYFQKIVEGRLVQWRLFSILFMDLDGFKSVNDELGHDVGDLVLKETAKRLISVFRGNDLVCRFGGDEFAVLLARDDGDERRLETLMARIRNVVESIDPLALANIPSDKVPAGKTYRIGISIGAASFPADGKTFEVLIDRADEAMYEEKNLRKKSR